MSLKAKKRTQHVRIILKIWSKKILKCLSWSRLASNWRMTLPRNHKKWIYLLRRWVMTNKISTWDKWGQSYRSVLWAATVHIVLLTLMQERSPKCPVHMLIRKTWCLQTATSRLSKIASSAQKPSSFTRRKWPSNIVKSNQSMWCITNVMSTTAIVRKIWVKFRIVAMDVKNEIN